MIYVIPAAGVVLALYVVYLYNGFVSLRVRVNEAWSDIQVQMKLRYDLVPNLVETVKGYAGHEAGVLTDVTQARTEAMTDNGTPEQQARSENILASALKSLFAVAEDYPELEANENFLSLQTDLMKIESNIQAARRFYNGNVRAMNIKVDQFPSNIVAGLFGFRKAEFFELDDEDAARRPVEVDFDDEA